MTDTIDGPDLESTELTGRKPKLTTGVGVFNIYVLGTMITWSEEQIDRLRQQNDDVDLDPLETAAIRGQIQLLKDIKRDCQKLLKPRSSRSNPTHGYY